MNDPVGDTLRVSGIECFGYHGVFAEEKRAGQPFIVDLRIWLDTRAAAATDDLTLTVDYGSLALDVKAAVESDPVDLIETVAERIAQVCLSRELVEAVRVDLHKPHAPIEAVFSDVVVTITRRRHVAEPVGDTPGHTGNHQGQGVRA